MGEPARGRNDSANAEATLIFDFVLLIARECGELIRDGGIKSPQSKIENFSGDLNHGRA
jgi:hypothetical protein